MKRRLWLIPLLSVGIGLIQTVFVQSTQEMVYVLSNSLGIDFYEAHQIMSVIQAVFALVLILASGLIFLRKQTKKDMAISALITSICFLLIGLITEVLFYFINYLGIAYQYGSIFLRFMRFPLAAYFSIYTCVRNLMTFRQYFFMGDLMRFVYLILLTPLPFINVLFAWGKRDDTQQAPQPYQAGGFQPPYGGQQGYGQQPYQPPYQGGSGQSPYWSPPVQGQNAYSQPAAPEPGQGSHSGQPGPDPYWNPQAPCPPQPEQASPPQEPPAAIPEAPRQTPDEPAAEPPSSGTQE